MKILALTKYPVKGPSSRYRFLQYLPSLTFAGHDVHVVPLFDTAYLDRLFSGQSSSAPYLLRRCLSRLLRCIGGRTYDLAWIEGELMPFMPAGLECLLHGLLPSRRVYDFDDAIWCRYTGKSLLENKFRKILSTASGIVAGNAYLANYLGEIGPEVCIIPTVVQWEKYQDAKPALEGHTIGWIGSPSTRFFLDALVPAFQNLAREQTFVLKLIGADMRIPGVTVVSEPWSAASEVSLIASFDIGVMPLEDSAFARGKCGLKLIQYLATGVPAVASPVGVNRTILEDSGGGFLATTPDQWCEALSKLLKSSHLRQIHGASGRCWARDTVTVAAQAPRLIRFLESRFDV